MCGCIKFIKNICIGPCGERVYIIKAKNTRSSMSTVKVKLNYS